MKAVKRVIALVLAVVLCIAFAACGTTTNNTSSSATGSQESKKATSDAAEAKPTNGKLVMATNASFPPYEYYENETIVGIDAEVAALIADKLGMELEIKDMEFGSIIGAVQTGSVDMGMAGMTVTEDRLVTVDFSDTYATAVQVVIVKEGSEIQSVDDLTGKKIGVQENTTGDIYASEDFGEENIKRYSKGNDAVAALAAGIIDAVIIDNEPAKSYVAANDGLAILETSYADEEYAIAISKENTELKEKINKALGELKADGTLDSIIKKYIPEE
ncbi:MAG: amino acid ABC transporter substrate-binding protein [Clostridia bacterium]|nr:amino acid ABC transporter substrate-binding protein [Clostridia bacterium]MBQ2152193.1 amino acid ABC transporter substrate-binding protein [Clostridia bacterium]